MYKTTKQNTNIHIKALMAYAQIPPSAFMDTVDSQGEINTERKRRGNSRLQYDLC